MYYFAYGSNMDEEDLRKWCESEGRTLPEWRLIGAACLEGYELSFNYRSVRREGGAANLMERPGRRAYGLLFEITKNRDLETIRKKEGYPNHYDEITVSLKQGDKSIDNVKTFKVVKSKEILASSVSITDIIHANIWQRRCERS